jgi:glycosyltransferase involved in cell wall biosynthesis
MDQQPAPSAPIAYLTGQYPKVSHTFIQREIAALRDLGLTVLTCQVRRAAPQDIPADQAEEAAATFTILDAAKNPVRLIGAHLGLILRHPGRWFGALRLALATRPPGAKAALWQLFYLAEAGVLADHLQRNRVAHLHNHFADASGTVAMLAGHLAAIPYSLTEHGPNIFFDAPRWRLDEKIARARFVACISHFCRSQLMLFSDRAHWPRLHIVRCGILPERYGTAAREGYGQRVLFIGRLDAVKGVPVLLEAFAALRAQAPGARLTLVGDGPHRAALEAQAASLGGAVRFTGYLTQEAVAAELAAHDVLVLPSFAEGVPVVLMEAMASRLPVIATRVGGVAELVEDGVNGFLVPPGDAATLAERLGRLIADPELCRRMGLAGRATVEARHDVRTEAAKLAALFRGAA